MVEWRAGCASVGVVVAMCLLAGCSDPGPAIAQEVRSGVPEGLVVEPLGEGPVAVWIDPGETFAIVTWGSGSCPPVATALTTDGPDRLDLTFGPSPNDPCTADMSPTTHEFELPDEITRSPVTVNITYEDWPGTDVLTLE